MTHVRVGIQRFVLPSLVGLVVMTGCGESPAPQPPPTLGPVALDEGPRRVEVLFLGHASEHHNSGAYAPILAAALGKDGINITYTEDPDDLNPETLALYDGLIVYANHDEITEAQNEALMDFVESGHGFVPIHSASYSFRNSEEYVAMVGAQFESHGTGTFTTEFTNTDHPVMAGLEPFETWDETYVHTMHNEDRTVLMERVDEDGREPWTWVRNQGEGRVVYTAYGHDERTWSHPMFLRLVRNGILWAVGDDISSRLAAFEIEPLTYAAQSAAPIPNYEQRPEALPLQDPLPPEASFKHYQIPPGFQLELFASEPMVVNPISMAWDERGRLWVVETVDYPNDPVPDGQGNDAIKILEDTDGDGRADKSTTFAEGLSIPTGIVFTNGGVLISHQPDFLFLADTDGDDVADVREAYMDGWGTRDTHAGPSNLHYGFDNWLWGTVGYSSFEGVVGGEELEFGAGVYRIRPDGSEMEFVSDFTNNTWGLAFSEDFDIFGSTANNEHSVYVAIPRRYYEGVEGLDSPGRKKIDGHYAMHSTTPNIRQVDVHGGFTAAAGHNLYTARAFPQEYWNRIALVAEPTGNLLHRAILEPIGSGFAELDGWNLLSSPDEWASPVHAEVGPDGAVWVADWYNFIVQHNPTPQGFDNGEGNAYDTPLRDKRHGRIYRLSYKGAPAYEPMALSADEPAGLIAGLRHSNMFWRMTAQRLLVERGEQDVVDDLVAIVEDRSVDAIGLNSPAVHAIWTLHGLGALDGSNAGAQMAVRAALNHPAAGVRKNALMALPKDDATLDALVGAGGLEDEDPNTRLHVFLALSEMEPSLELGQRIYELSKDESILEDEWLPTALYIASFRHKEGFLQAYAAEIGTLEFVDLIGRVANGEMVFQADWSGPALDDSEWQTLAMPTLLEDTELGEFTGVIWGRYEFELPANAGGRAATVSLGRIDDGDVTYVNGVEVGSILGSGNAPRSYEVPEGVLRSGRNVLAVRISNERGRGGFRDTPEDMTLTGNGFQASLAGDWRFEVERVWEGGRRPDFEPGIPFAQQFLLHYNPAGVEEENDAPQFGGRGGGRGGFGGGPAPESFTTSLSAVPGENRFDQGVITVQAGQLVTIAFDNTDDMPHNVVVLESGRLEAFGEELDAFASDPDAAEQSYIPDSDEVLFTMEMVDPRESGRLTFFAPNIPGDYPFVCTYPGHWVTMRGVIRVGG